MKLGIVTLLAGGVLLGATGCSYMTAPAGSSREVTSNPTADCIDCQAAGTTAGTKTSEEVATIKTVFTASIKEDLTYVSDSDYYKLWVENPEAVTDPENILKSFQADGVVLNLSPEQVPEEVKDQLVVGNHVKVELAGIPIMTMSLPPQLPGRSILQITLVDAGQ